MAIIRKFKPFHAPARYVFKDPDTGYNYTGESRKQLYTRINNYRLQNGLKELQALDWVIDDYLCGLPENEGRCEPAKLRRGWYKTIRGGIGLLENVVFKKIAKPEEAERRAKICLSCPANIFPDRTSFVKWADEVAEASVGENKVSTHDKLGNCSICSCNLRAKVWYDGLIKLSSKERAAAESVNPKCWQLEKI